jgi:dihydroneopterin aldolase
MIKFLLYLFLFYVIFRLLFGRFMGTSIKGKVFRFETHHHYHQKKQTEEQEGNITINHKLNNTKKPNDKNLGEYVDYEEVK